MIVQDYFQIQVKLNQHTGVSRTFRDIKQIAFKVLDRGYRRSQHITSSGVIHSSFILLVLTGILISSSSFQPRAVMNEIQEKFNSFYAQNESAKLTLVTNQSLFVAGDTVRFVAYYLNESNQFIKGSHIAQLDVISPAGKTKHRMLFRVKDGIATNQLILPADMQASNYRLVASTSLIRRYGHDLLLWKEIQVVKEKNLEPSEASNNLRLFPEGGKIVSGVMNTILVKGLPSATFSLQGKFGTENILEGKLDESGISTFSFTPSDTKGYSLVSRSGSQALAIDSDGIVMNVTSGERCEIRMSIPKGSSLQGRELSAIITSQGKIVTSREIVLKESEPAVWYLPSIESKASLYQIHVFDANSTLLAQRVFVPHTAPSSTCQIVGKDSVRVRNASEYTIKLLDALGNSQEGNVTVHVFRKDLFHNQRSGTFLQFLDLPELDDWIYSHAISDLSRINDYLISQQLNRINWKRILKEEESSITYSNSPTTAMRGTVRSKVDGSIPKDSLLLIAYLQKNALGLETPIRKGRFVFPFDYDFWGQDIVFFNLRNNGKWVNADYEIMIQSDSLDDFPFPERVEGKVNSTYASYQFNRAMALKSYTFFTSVTNTTTSISNPNQLLEEELNGVDFTVNVTDYIQFSSMEELIREVVPFVQSKKKGEKNIVRMSFRYETSAIVYKQDPLYIIDGQMTQDTELFMNLPTSDILFVKLINNPNKLAQLGQLGKNGVVFVQTKSQQHAKSLLNGDHFPILGLSVPLPLVEKESRIDKRIPDLRSTLGWYPAKSVGQREATTFSLLASDDVGIYTIRISGFTGAGQPLLIEQDVTVIFDRLNK